MGTILFLVLFSALDKEGKVWKNEDIPKNKEEKE